MVGGEEENCVCQKLLEPNNGYPTNLLRFQRGSLSLSPVAIPKSNIHRNQDVNGIFKQPPKVIITIVIIFIIIIVIIIITITIMKPVELRKY